MHSVESAVVFVLALLLSGAVKRSTGIRRECRSSGLTAPGPAPAPIFDDLDELETLEDSTPAAVNITEMIVAGTPAPPCKYPYLASLKHPILGIHLCAGTLINPQWILTAASCVDTRFSNVAHTNPTAHLNGELLNGDFDESIATLPPPISRVHEQYEGVEAGGFNVALLKLERPSSQPPIALIDPNDSVQVDEELAFAGWGHQATNGGFAISLQEAVGPMLVDSRTCEVVYGQDFDGRILCVGDGSQDFCQGDEGGPAVREGSETRADAQVAIGIPAEGNCGSFGRPARFTALQHLLGWINDTMSRG